MQANQEKVRRRRTYSVEFKQAAVQASQQPGASLSGVALARGLNANLLRRWVDEARSGTLRAAMKGLGLAIYFGRVCAAATDGCAARTHSHHAAARCHHRAGGLARESGAALCGLAAGPAGMIRIDAIWLAVEPLDMPSGRVWGTPKL